MSGSGISWALCKSAPRCRQATTPAPHHSVFTGRMSLLPPNQQCQSNEGQLCYVMRLYISCCRQSLTTALFPPIFAPFRLIMWPLDYIGARTATNSHCYSNISSISVPATSVATECSCSMNCSLAGSSVDGQVGYTLQH